MIDFLTKAWPMMMIVAVAIGGITSYWLKVLQIRELKHKINELQQHERKRKQSIQTASIDEECYTRRAGLIRPFDRDGPAMLMAKVRRTTELRFRTINVIVDNGSRTFLTMF